MTNQSKYDHNKDRQGLFNQDFFEQSYENNLMLLNVTFQCEKDYPTDRLQMWLTSYILYYLPNTPQDFR